MVHDKDQDKFRILLHNKRNRLLDYRTEWKESWQTLQEKETEMEEAAQKELLARTVEGLDEQSVAVVEAIDNSGKGWIALQGRSMFLEKPRRT